ncbi:hypothetical protein CRYUN_Cryun16bG0084000 [Craigia yunnanensis]
MSRFLRYHPINEFEPFFESLGLKPYEYTPLLPRDLMFLSDDCLLLENYRVLCEHGIERNKIGQIYKKAVQVFQYEFGVLPLKLQAYKELGLSESFMAKIIVCSPCVLIGDVDMKFIKVLEILRSVEFDHVWIKEHLSDQDSYNWSMILRVLNFFSEMGCSMDQILSVFLQFQEIQVGQFVSNLNKCFLFLHEIEMEVDEIGKIENPQELDKWGIGTRVGPLPVSVEDIESQRGGELQERFDSIVNAGLDKEDVSEMVSVSPQILNQSKAVIQSKIDILVNELGYPLSTLVSFPSYLSYAIQRVGLRLAMYNWLKDQEKVEPDLALSTIVACSDKIFLSQYVNHHPSGPPVWQDLKSKIYPG